KATLELGGVASRRHILGRFDPRRGGNARHHARGRGRDGSAARGRLIVRAVGARAALADAGLDRGGRPAPHPCPPARSSLGPRLPAGRPGAGTERPGRLRIVERSGAVSPPIAGVPAVVAKGQGGLLDVALDPQFAKDHLIYLSYAEAGEGGAGTAVARA